MWKEVEISERAPTSEYSQAWTEGSMVFGTSLVQGYPRMAEGIGLSHHGGSLYITVIPNRIKAFSAILEKNMFTKPMYCGNISILNSVETNNPNCKCFN